MGGGGNSNDTVVAPNLGQLTQKISRSVLSVDSSSQLTFKKQEDKLSVDCIF